MTAFDIHPQLKHDTYTIGHFPLSMILLMNCAQYPWIILVPKRIGALELIDLDPDDSHQFIDEIGEISHAIKQLFNPHKLNVAALGNIVPQLHVHIIGRFTYDACWPEPVWGKTLERYTDASCERNIEILQRYLSNVAGFSA
jgi:diadenosine tetraphosphate (Ap4A) HIT family hydrolase